MRSDEQRYKTIGLMIFTAIIIFSVVGIVIIGFKMVKKNEEAKLVAAADTEYMKKQKSVRQMQGYILFRGMRRVQTATRRQIIYPIQR